MVSAPVQTSCGDVAASLSKACLDASSLSLITIDDYQGGSHTDDAAQLHNHLQSVAPLRTASRARFSSLCALGTLSPAEDLPSRQQLRDRALPCALPAFYSKPISGSRRLPANTLAHDQIVNFPINALHFNPDPFQTELVCWSHQCQQPRTNNWESRTSRSRVK